MSPSPLDRRRFLKRFGAAGAAGAALAGARTLGDGKPQIAIPPVPRGGAVLAAAESHTHEGHGGHGGLGPVGTVDHARNGFSPHEILTDFDGGEVSRDIKGQTVREYDIVVTTKDIEIAPGLFFPAWTYNGRVPGPTIRATEGDRIRINFTNTTPHPHTMHFHGFHSAGMDGIPGAGEARAGETFIYDFIAEPFGTHLYHCHSLPLRQHIHRGLYGAFIVDPKKGRPEANEMVMVMNAFDTNFDGGNEVYAINSIAFAYMVEPIQIRAGELQRAHVINLTEFDPINSIHLHANFFHLYRTGTSLVPDEFTDTISMAQAERHMIEFTYDHPGMFMFHAHQTEFTQLGWMSFFEVK
ncbi:MAG TPA: multicopper oxidase domain-containing protein [Actinomycetota bacterium]|nr:multicopper oxidase domain-containing protein [Actinomycetota bacterium]